MQELSLNVLDVAQNSVSAGASLIEIGVAEDTVADRLTIVIKDNGCGMTEEQVQRVIDPFYTTRTTRKVGMGVPLLMLAAEQTGGTVTIQSRHEEDHPEDHGTVVTATFHTDHIDFTPIGDLVSTMETLIMGSPEIDFTFVHDANGHRVELDTRQLREVLGEVPLDSYEIIQWIGDFLREQYQPAE